MAKSYFKKNAWNKNDEFYTPAILVKPILEYLKPNSTIWCPFDTVDSEYVKVLMGAGHTVIYTHIFKNEDFFELDIDCNYIISDPPFSKKLDVFERLFKLNKPFAMLMNMSASQYQNVGEFFYDKQQCGKNTQILMVDKKVSFDGETFLNKLLDEYVEAIKK